MDSNQILGIANKALTIKPWPPADLFPPSRYYRFLQVLAEEMHPTLSVELGVCGGGGSLYLAEGWKAGQVVGVDCSFDHPDQISWIQAHYPNFEFWRGDSVDSAAEIARRYGQVDILFIDTSHTFEQTIMEFTAWKPYLSSRAIVCFDDLFRPTMPEAWEAIKARYKLRLDFLHDGAVNGGGFGAMWGFDVPNQ